MSLAVRLREYERADVHLDDASAAELTRVAGKALDVTPGFDRSTWTLKANAHVGSIAVDGLRILITPKVDAANLFHMLEAGGDPLRVREETFEYERTGDLLPAFATFYAASLERGLARGLPRQYHPMDDRLVALRGRVDVKGQMRAGGLPLPVACRFDEHTADTQLNRLLRGAAVRLLRLPGVAPRTSQVLSGLASRLDEAAAVQPADIEQKTSFTRLDEHLRTTERLARLVLSGSSVTNELGTVGASAFVVNMNEVFEAYLEAQLRRSLAGRLQVIGQWTTPLDTGSQIGMRPDLVFRRAGQPVFVGDAKYKLTGDGFGRDSDYYQLFAYATALALPAGVLVYCQHDGSAPPRSVTVRNAETVLHTRAIKLAGSPVELDAQVAGVGDWIEASLQ